MNNVPIFIQYILAIGIFQGLLISYLLIAHAQASSASRILGGWCLLFALSFTTAMIYIHGLGTYFVYLFGWLDFFPTSYGALLYLYCRQLFTRQPLNKRDLLHVIPFLTMMVLNYEILFASFEARMTLITDHQSQSIIQPVSKWLMFGQAYVYMFFAIRLTLHHQQRAQSELANFHPQTFSWIKTLLFFNFVIWSLKLIANFSEEWRGISFSADALIVALIYVIGLAQWKNPEIFQIKLPEASLRITNKEEPSFTEHRPKTQSTTLQLEEGTRASILEAALSLLVNDQQFKNKDLNLQMLAELVGVSQHHLSESINQNAGVNFYQLVNQHRVSYVCDQLTDNPELKVIDLCYEAGFSSKSTFNSVFKKYTHMTPSQFRSKVSQPA
jgi:AraC-like DNA-binding protein